MKYKLNSSFHKSTNRGSKQEKGCKSLADVEKKLKHNDRRYKSSDELPLSCRSKIDKELSVYNLHLEDKKQTFKEFLNNCMNQSVLDEYNKGKKPCHQIKNYAEHIIQNIGKQNLCEEIIASLGNEDTIKPINELFIKNENGKKTIDEDYKNFWYEYTKEYKKFLNDHIPDFKIYTIDLHLDETTPHIHTLGTPFAKIPKNKKGKTNGLSYRLSSRNVFNTETLTQLHKDFRNFNKEQVKKFNDFLNNKNVVWDTKTNKPIFKENAKKSLFTRKIKEDDLENFELEANQENLGNEKKSKIKDKDLLNVKNKILTKQYKKDELEELQKILDHEIDRQLKNENLKLKNQLENSKNENNEDLKRLQNENWELKQDNNRLIKKGLSKIDTINNYVFDLFNNQSNKENAQKLWDEYCLYTDQNFLNKTKKIIDKEEDKLKQKNKNTNTFRM